MANYVDRDQFAALFAAPPDRLSVAEWNIRREKIWLCLNSMVREIMKKFPNIRTAERDDYAQDVLKHAGKKIDKFDAANGDPFSYFTTIIFTQFTYLLGRRNRKRAHFMAVQLDYAMTVHSRMSEQGAESHDDAAFDRQGISRLN